MKAQKKPIIIDYFLFENNHPKEIIDWVETFNDKFHDHFKYTHRNSNSLTVKTLEGTSYPVTVEDVIIRGINGEYYPCKKEIFNKTYDVL